MGIQIGAKPDCGFDDPIGMLKDCHRRVERFLRIRCILPTRARGRALDIEEADAVKAALHYFRTSGIRHTADEEESLFPRLRAESLSGISEALDRLQGDRSTANQLHAIVDSIYNGWLAQGSLQPVDQLRLKTTTAEMEHLYKEHIQVEETIVFPPAVELFNCETIAAMGLELSIRRK